MALPIFQSSQRELTRYLRDPEAHSGPKGVEARRLAIYRDLFFKNIEGFLSSGFPVCRSLYSDSDWIALVRDFMRSHRCQSPYFLKIAEEFIDFLQNERRSDSDPDFLLELAHYEWVELALDVAEEDLPSARPLPESLLAAPLKLSPLAWPLSYRYPVHKLGPGFRPEAAPVTPTCIVVYRNRHDSVQFMEINPVTARLLALLDSSDCAFDALQQLAAELSTDAGALTEFAADLLQNLFAADIIYGAE